MTGLKSNKESKEAKLFINGVVDDMKKEYSKAKGNAETQRDLIKNFREITSSEDYKKYIGIVNQDAKTLRKGIKPWLRTQKKFEKEKEEFYGCLNTYLTKDELKEWEEKDTYEKLDFICNKFGGGYRSLSLVLSMFYGDDLSEKYANFHDLRVDLDSKKEEVLGNIDEIDESRPYCDSSREDREIYWGKKREKEKILNEFRQKEREIAKSRDKLDLEKRHRSDLIMERLYHMSGKKFNGLALENLVDLEKKFKSGNFFDKIQLILLSNPTIFSDDTNNIMDHLASVLSNQNSFRGCDMELENLEYFFKNCIKNLENHHETLATKLVNSGKNGAHIFKIYSDKFTGLTDEKRFELMGKDLAKEKFYDEMAKFKRIGENLGIKLEVKDEKNGKDEENGKRTKRGLLGVIGRKGI